MDADHQALLLHSEVRWLSRGRVLKHVCDLLDKVVIFLRKQHFVAVVDANLSMEGAGFTVIDYAAKVAAYYKKLVL